MPGLTASGIAQVVLVLVFVIPVAVIVPTFILRALFAAIDTSDGLNPVAIIGLLFGLFVFGVIIWGLVTLVRSNGRSKWERWMRLTHFAEANGLAFSPRDDSPAYPGSIFNQGHSRSTLEHVRSVHGRFLDMGNYRYTTGSGKNATTHNWGFMAFNLDRKLPHMVLDSRANNGLFGGSNLPTYFDKSQILSLEGDFDQYFTLYCPREYERDALYVFTPDLMALLIDEASPFDVEIIDDWMFVYSAKPFKTGDPAVYQRLFRILDTVGEKTLTQTDFYADERVGDRTIDYVAPQGQRLKRGFSVGAAITVGAFVLIWGWSFLNGLFH